VWLQLLELCGQYSECMPSILRVLRQQLTGPQQFLLTQQQQLVTQQQQLMAQQQQMIDIHLQQQQQQQRSAELQQQQIADLQQQLSSARALAAWEAGELRGQLRALEGQVQQLMQALQDKG